MFIEIIKADYLDVYRGKLLFNNGADFAPDFLYEIGVVA